MPVKAHGTGRSSGSATRRVIAWRMMIAGSSIRPSSLIMNAAMAKTSSGNHQTSGRARTACHQTRALSTTSVCARCIWLVTQATSEYGMAGWATTSRAATGAATARAVNRYASHPVRLAATAKRVSETA